jgi:hypothetical protein
VEQSLETPSIRATRSFIKDIAGTLFPQNISTHELQVVHPPMSISESGELREILFMQKVSFLHVLSIHCTTLAKSLHSVAKDAFQYDFFNTPKMSLTP